MDTVEGVLHRLNQLLADVERAARTDVGKSSDLGSSERPHRASSEKGSDAIDELINSRRRASSVRGLRDSEAFERFKQELVDGLVRVDAAHRLLDLVEVILAYAGVRR